MEATVSAEPLSAELAPATEPCAHCGVPLAHDQRYCLECGAPRGYLSGLQQLDGLRVAALGAASPGAGPYAQGAPHTAVQGYQYPPAGDPYGGPPTPPAYQGGQRWGGPAGLIAGVGVLLLAMGVGVLIGRSGASSGKTTAPPAQVITVDQTGAAGTGTGTETSATQAPTPSTSGHGAKKKSSAKSGASGSSAAKSGSGNGVGESIDKPAPPSVLKNEKSGSGANYEQKSKNLPNVISTG